MLAGLIISVGQFQTMNTGQSMGDLSTSGDGSTHPLIQLLTVLSVFVEWQTLGHIHCKKDVPLVGTDIEHLDDRWNLEVFAIFEFQTKLSFIFAAFSGASFEGDRIVFGCLSQPYIAKSARAQPSLQSISTESEARS